MLDPQLKVFPSNCYLQHEDWDWVEAEANDIALILLADVVDLNDTFVSVVDLAPSGLYYF